jgi:hypothetical protein
MHECKNWLGAFGMAALIAGFFVFGASHEFSTNWARWFFGPLLWFVGFALVVGWIVQTISKSSAKQDETDKLASAAKNGN